VREPARLRRLGPWHVMVMAKEPRPGRVKTRLCPPLTPVEAAAVAEACLADTLEAVANCGADRLLVALDGKPGSWLPPGFTIIPQRGNSFPARLANAWSDSAGPGLQIGMDTPQVTPSLIDACLTMTEDPASTATLGFAIDGGWWALGLSRGWDTDIFSEVPMSRADTGIRQLAVLRGHNHRVGLLPELEDVDTVEALHRVAALADGSRLGPLAASLEERL
jgi:glycosyltransferase A (GT-A) superfamily protein (DUF2064 family)